MMTKSYESNLWGKEYLLHTCLWYLRHWLLEFMLFDMICLIYGSEHMDFQTASKSHDLKFMEQDVKKHEHEIIGGFVHQILIATTFFTA